MTAKQEQVTPIEVDVAGVTTSELLRGAVAVVRLLLPKWRAARPKDRRPEMAVEAVEEWLARPLPNLASHASLIAKECTKARSASLGDQHQIAEAARAIAQIPSARTDTAARACSIEALAKAEEYALYRHAIAGIYGKQPEVRHGILSTLRESAARKLGGSSE